LVSTALFPDNSQLILHFEDPIRHLLLFLIAEMRLSPPELSYLYTSLTSSPPLRPDLRSLTQYRPYSIQTDFLSTANGSTRITWGTGRQGGDVLVVIKAQIGDSVEITKGVQGGQVYVDVTTTDNIDDDDNSTAFLVETLTSVLCPRQFSSYGIDLRSLVITERKAWHVWIDCVVQLPVNAKLML
jgi:exosome complex component RRP42